MTNAYQEEAGPLKPGDIVQDRYRIRSIAGRGGMSLVYAAEDVKLPGKWWAVKVSRRHAADPRGFAEEAAMLAGLDHPFLPKVADFFPPGEDGYSILVTDFVRGENLQSLYSSGRLQSGKILKYALQLCDLFAYLHSLKPDPVIYRDLKPANVMVDDQDNVRLVDFGIARRHKLSGSADTVLLGTVGFAAPEQYGGGQTDSRTDLFTLGAMVFYLLTGHYYQAEKRNSRELLEGCSREEWAAVLDKLLQAEPGRRYPDARSLKADLEALPLRTAGKRSEGQGDARLAQGEDRWEHKAQRAPFSGKTIVVGALYGGAGATFAAISLCRVLGGAGYPNALVEFSVKEPELYALLYGDRNAPAKTICLQDLLEPGEWVGKRSWTQDETVWIPQRPEEDSPVFTLEQSYRLQRAMKDRVAVYDISAEWQAPGVAELCRHADLIVAIAGLSPAKLSGRNFRHNAGQLLDWQDAGMPVVFGVNRHADFSGSREWMRSLPFMPELRIPELPVADIASSEWKGRFIQDQSEYRKRLTEAFAPILGKMVTNDPIGGRGVSFLRRLGFK